MFRYALLGILALAVIGCSSDSASSSTAGASSTTGASSTDNNATTGSSSDVQISTVTSGVGEQPKDGQDVAIIETNLGRIVVKFFPDKAPGHVKNFIALAKKGFYDGTKFHRVIPGFMIQAGDPNSKDNDRSNDGSGGPGYTIKAEFNDIHHGPGILSMARRSDGPDTAGSQFYIVVADAPHLDNQYTAFGEVVEGMDVANKIVALPRDERDNPLEGNPAIIQSIKVDKWPLK